MENIKRVLSYIRRAVDDYQMIKDGDKVAVGISGGKDSLTLLCALADLRRFYPQKFDLCAITVDMGFSTPISLLDPRFAAMQVFNNLFGGGMTCKLFQNIREKKSLCYDIGSGYYGTKGLLSVSAGIDCDKDELVQELILKELDDCRKGEITDEELLSAQEALISSLRSTNDSPGSIEGYYATGMLSGFRVTPEVYIDRIRAVTREDVMEAANLLELKCVYFLKGVEE